MNVLGTFNARAHILLHDIDLNGGNESPHGEAVREIEQERIGEKLVAVGRVVLAGAAVAVGGCLASAGTSCHSR